MHRGDDPLNALVEALIYKNKLHTKTMTATKKTAKKAVSSKKKVGFGAISSKKQSEISRKGGIASAKKRAAAKKKSAKRA